jgi:undecaprenyl-diphosphatase
MNLLQAVALGFVQGVTEFLPISSSGHLVLVPWLLGWSIEPRAAFIFNVLVQWGTLLAVIMYFRHDLTALIRAAINGLFSGNPLQDPDARLAWLILAAGLPATVIGIVFKQQVTEAFKSPLAISFFLLFTAGILFISDRLVKHKKPISELTPAGALWIGFSQALALFPGVSRSGATIAGGLTRGLSRPESARFSFLIAIPVMFGAGLVAVVDLTKLPNGLDQAAPLLSGVLVATVVGYFSIRWLIQYLAQRSLSVFALYCAIVGLIGLLLSVFRG